MPGVLAWCLHSPLLAQTQTPPTAASKVRPGAASTAFAHNAEAMTFARAIDAREGWTDGWAVRWVQAATHTPQAIRLMRPTPPGTARNWNVYRDRFVEPQRLQAGVRFWRTHEAHLQRAEATYGVPAWLIVGIIGVETLYGEHMGTFRVLDALTTLAFHFPADHPRAAQRTAFFQAELDAFLRKTRASGTDPLTWRGSFAGAIGLPQFMPSNWGLYGVDFDGDGQVDLVNSPADAIGSVARYLQAFGWETNMPTHFAVAFDTPRLQLDTLLAPSILPTFTAQAFQSLGVQLAPEGQDHPGLLALVELENGDPARGGQPRVYVAGTRNFYVITRYNQSSYYAMAVIELGRAVEALWKP